MPVWCCTFWADVLPLVGATLLSFASLLSRRIACQVGTAASTQYVMRQMR